MNRVLRKANVTYDPSIITVATDHKRWSRKHISNILFGILWVVPGLFMLGLAIYIVFGYPGNWDGIFFIIFGSATNQAGWFGNVILFLMSVIYFFFSMFLLIMGLAGGLFPSSTWTFVLYPNAFLYKGNDKTVEEPISSIQSCYIIKKIHTNRYEKTIVNIHVKYMKDHQDHFVSLTHYDGYNEINEIISYLQDEKGIPVYFTSFYGVSKKDLEELENQEVIQIEFNNDIKSYIRS